VLGLGLNPISDTLTIASFPIPGAENQFGISGTIILTESHAGCHTWPEHKYIRIEVSSCAPVEKEVFEGIIRAYFIPFRLETKVISWG